MGAQRYPRGLAGGKRDMRDKVVPGRKRARLMNRRVQEALETARRDRAALDARIAAEEAAYVLQQASGTFVVPNSTIVLEIRPEAEAQALLDEYDAAHPALTQEEFVAAVEAAIPEMRERFRSLAEADATRWQAGAGVWTLQDAVDMLEDGYQLLQVVRKTGWGAGWFEDFQLDGGYLSR